MSEKEKNNEVVRTKCPQCLKMVSETDNCDTCDQEFCKECLTYYEKLAFCPKCERK